ncbi:carbohydrate-binding module family 10 protein [Piromyces sp. E2]|nr:carbohydrate-binding module family 10 protein [Piromyces sp. E2]|eukprot:OUM58455.1 carbohydrate-binding module family 10 protein [Piromyces sp. E2]
MKFVLGVLLVSSLLLNNIEASVPKCSDCEVFATGKDGTLWGWEDDSFCRLSSKCSSSSGSSKTKTTAKLTTTVIKKTTSIKKDDPSKTSSSEKATTKPSSSDSSSASSSDATTTESNPNYSSSGTVAISATSMSVSNDGNHETCKGCNVAATGGDGSLWGWEDNATCIIDTEACKITTPNDANKTNSATTTAERGSDGILICSTCEYTRIDEDTTTWNKENGEDCRVIGSRCGFNKTPHPWCSGCVVTGTGGDGALYGWENNASCLINEIDCGLVKKPGTNNTSKVNAGNSKVEVESAANAQYFINAYYIIVTLATLLIARGF